MQMNLEDIMLREIRQDTERQILYDLTSTWNLENPDPQNQPLPGLGSDRNEEMLVNGTNFQSQGE